MYSYKAFVARLSTVELLIVYNTFADSPIKKFRDRATAENRTAKLMEEKEIKSLDELDPVLFGPKTTEKLKSLPKNFKTSGPVGKRSKFSGKRLFKLVKENPRRKGSCGYTSFNLIRDDMTYEEYRMLGGRSNDLQWDINHGYVAIK